MRPDDPETTVIPDDPRRETAPTLPEITAEGDRILRLASEAWETPRPGGSWGKLRIDALLGEGGMGRVFRAWDPALRRPVALKCLRTGDPVAVKRLLLEAQAQARVDHPHVCKVYEVGEVRGQPYIAMQLLQGKDSWRPAAR